MKVVVVRIEAQFAESVPSTVPTMVCQMTGVGDLLLGSGLNHGKFPGFQGLDIGDSCLSH